MLKSVNRLKKDNDFQAVFRSGRKVRQGCLTVFVNPNNTGQSRCAVVVSKKISRHSVGRNRIRRVLLAELAELLRAGRLPSESDVIVRVTSLPAEGLGETELREQLRQCFGR